MMLHIILLINCMILAYAGIVPIKPMYLLKKGQDFELICRYNGEPKPRVYWERVEHTVYHFPAGDGSTLRFSPATPSDSGWYWCRAGEDEFDSTIIFVSERP